MTGETRESLKEKYWNGQIKSMLGPCMITFAIPITIPGVTITLVAFSEEKSLPKYGALHVTGLILLIVAVLLILIGCVLKYLWKPFIPDDIEMQLTPYSSFRNPSTARRNKLDGIYTDRDSKLSKESQKRDRDSDVNKQQSSMAAVVPPIETRSGEQRHGDDLPSDMSRYSNETPSCSGLSGVHVVSGTIGSDLSRITQVDSDTDRYSGEPGIHYTRSNSQLDPISRMPSSSRRQLPPISPRPLTSQGTLEGNPSFDEIQMWRKKKKRKKRQPSDVSTEPEEEDRGIINQGSDCDDDSLKKAKNKLTVTQETEDMSGGSARSSNRSLLENESKEKADEGDKKQKRRKRKKKRLSSLKQASIDKDGEDGFRSVEKEDTDYQRPLRMSQAEDNEEYNIHSDN